MTKLNEIKKELLPLVRKEAWLKLPEPIQLSSGKMSDRYFDGRKITLHPRGMNLFARAILEMADLAKIDAVGGPSIGADPIATAVSLIAFLEKKKEIPAFLVRKEPKRYGLQKQVEGADLKPGMSVLIVEDVVTSGQSILNAISAVEANGAKIAQVICLLDRDEGGSAALHPYPFACVFKRSEVEAP